MTGSLPPSYPNEPLAIIEEEARAVAQCFGVALPEAAASSLIERILLRLGGAHIYLPKRTARDRYRIHRDIVARFNGRNIYELASEFDLTPRHVRRIITAANEKSVS